MRLGSKIVMSTVIFGSTFTIAGFCGLIPGVDPLCDRLGKQAELTCGNFGGGDPVEIIDKLEHSRRVLGWTKDALRLEGGELVKLPDDPYIPEQSELLSAATSSGVEIDRTTGRVYGLLQIWHNACGNDATQFHLARVDISSLLVFTDSIHSQDRLDQRCDVMDEQGWNVRCYWSFMYWLNEETGRAK